MAAAPATRAAGKRKRTYYNRKGFRAPNKTQFVKMKDDLTGGTNDVNPQYFCGRVSTVVANTAVTAAFIMPISRLHTQRKKTTVMEILRVELYPPHEIDTNAGQHITGVNMAVGTRNWGATEIFPDDPYAVAYAGFHQVSAFTNAQGYVVLDRLPYTIDLTDSQGHGTLVATDSLYVQLDTTAFNAAATGYFRILYRFKNVSMSEYVGIVQAQQ